MISATLVPVKQKVAAVFLLTFLMIESTIMSVVGGGVVGGDDFARGDEVAGEGWTERGEGARHSAGVKCGRSTQV